MALIGTAPVAAADLQMSSLYEQWLAARDAYNESEGSDEGEEAHLYSEVGRLEEAILATEPKTPKDYAFKLIVLNDFTGFGDFPWGDGILAEARKLIGA